MPVPIVGKQGFFITQNSVFDGLVKKLGPHAFTVYSCLLMHTDQDGKSSPSVKRLADACGVSRSTVQTCLQKLQEEGLISIQSQEREDGGTCANLYTPYPASWLNAKQWEDELEPYTKNGGDLETKVTRFRLYEPKDED